MIGPATQAPETIVAQTTSPFTLEMCHAILPHNFKIFYIERYEGMTDPLKYLGSYRVWMEFEIAEDSVMYRAFPLKLGRAAEVWLTSLRPRTIGPFNS